MRSASRSLVAAAFVLPLLLVFSDSAQATPVTVTVGTFSFDELIPAQDTSPAVDAFDILDLTGLGVDLDGNGIITPALTFSSLSATLTDTTGSTTTALGDLGANSALVDATTLVSPLLFPGTQLFTSAVLTGTVGGFTFNLADGSVFTALPTAFIVTLLPSIGTSLLAGDFVNITITGDLSTSTVPEPSTLLLVGVGAVAALRRRTRRTR